MQKILKLITGLSLCLITVPVMADYNISREEEIGRYGSVIEYLRLELDDDGDLDLTELEISQDGNEVVFRIREFRDGQLIDEDVVDRTINGFDRILVETSATCRLKCTNTFDTMIVLVNGSDLSDQISNVSVGNGKGGNDTISSCQSGYGGDGDDLIFDCGYSRGEDGDDILHGDRYSTTFPAQLFGGAGNDWLVGYDGNDNCYGGDGDDFLFGGEGNDLLIGGAGFDFIYGGNGDDTLDAGLSILEPAEEGEIVYGQQGADHFRQSRIGGVVVETWNDMNARRGDTESFIDFSASLFLWNYGGPFYSSFGF